ncbi:MAG: SH3 domain-containing protein [Planctomycetota bacterium]|nr:SH3 domain-containing protein [Planctomycetota bacterium]
MPRPSRLLTWTVSAASLCWLLASASPAAEAERTLVADAGTLPPRPVARSASLPDAAATATKEIFAQPVWGQVSAWRLNVRTGPSNSFGIVTTLKGGDYIHVYGQVGSWLEIDWPDDSPAWISRSFLDPDGTVRGDRVRVRARGTLEAPVLREVNRGEKLRIVGESGDWYKVAPPADAHAFIFAKYAILGVQAPAGIGPAQEPERLSSAPAEPPVSARTAVEEPPSQAVAATSAPVEAEPTQTVAAAPVRVADEPANSPPSIAIREDEGIASALPSAPEVAAPPAEPAVIQVPAPPPLEDELEAAPAPADPEPSAAALAHAPETEVFAGAPQVAAPRDEPELAGDRPALQPPPVLAAPAFVESPREEPGEAQPAQAHEPLGTVTESPLLTAPVRPEAPRRDIDPAFGELLPEPEDVRKPDEPAREPAQPVTVGAQPARITVEGRLNRAPQTAAHGASHLLTDGKRTLCLLVPDEGLRLDGHVGRRVGVVGFPLPAPDEQGPRLLKVSSIFLLE